MWRWTVGLRVVLPVRAVLPRGDAGLRDGLRRAELHSERGTDLEGLACSSSTRPC